MYLKSARGLMSLLEEKNESLISFGLVKLDTVVDTHWHEIADIIQKIENFYKNEKFKDRRLAALVASKVHFHLGNYQDAIRFALCAESLFDVKCQSLYAQTIISKALDMYIELQKFNAETFDETLKKPVDSKLKSLAETMFKNCLETKQHKEAFGFAVESYRVDMLERTLTSASPEEQPALLSYCTKYTLNFIQNRKYRNELLRCIVNVYLVSSKPDYINICQCLIYLEEPASVAEILKDRVQKSKEEALQAYQIAFDLYESATQQFISDVLRFLKNVSTTTSTDSPGCATPTDQADDTFQKRLSMLTNILSGNETVALHMQFLIKNNKTDMFVLKSIKDVIRTNITHNATVIANGFMHAGTTCDDFLRENLEWVSKASNWAKFTAVASLGVIHKGHEAESMKLLESYLPKENQESSAGYVEGGGLYALGLVHANHGNDQVIEFLKQQLNFASPNIKHGACLGLGLAAMGTHKRDVFTALRSCLYVDDAVLGEAAGLAMGLVMLGSKDGEATKEMHTYATETQHEKTLRGLCVGMSLLNYGRLEEATVLIEMLSGDKDPNGRRSAVYTLAMAYCGTGSADAIRRLLHISVSDVNDDVRRAAVTCLGFVLCKNPEHCPSMVALLAESFNPHVRYGAAMALGIACAGTASKDAIAILDPMLSDAVGYVRQGAMIAVAMILMQHNETTSSKVKDFRASLIKISGDKQEDSMTKLGAIIAHGILDAGGRNVTISLTTRNGHVDSAAVVGLLVFLQYWFWFPLTHFLVLAFRPTCVIALNSDLKMPKLEFRSDCKPSVYAYPPALQEKKEKPAEKVETAILSITAKQKKKELERDRQSRTSETKMDVDEPAAKPVQAGIAKPSSESGTEKAAPISGVKPPTATTSSGQGTSTVATIEPEPNFYMLSNPARVLNQQLKVISLGNQERYEPLKDVRVGGIIIFKDKTPAAPTELVELVKGGGVKVQDEEKMASPPEPFEYE